MKTRLNLTKLFTSLFVLSTMSMGLSVADDDLSLNDCPAEVKKTIQKHAGGHEIDDIDLISIQGRKIYVAEIEKSDDRDLKLYVASDGSLVKSREDISTRSLPEKVREAALSQGGSISDADKEVSDKGVIYFVEVDLQDGDDDDDDLQLTISADGQILSQRRDD